MHPIGPTCVLSKKGVSERININFMGLFCKLWYIHKLSVNEEGDHFVLVLMNDEEGRKEQCSRVDGIMLV